MISINEYSDLLSENITEFSDNTSIVSCAQTFVEDIQNDNVTVEVIDSNHFELHFEFDGSKYIIRCNKVNGKVGITGFYRSGTTDDDIVDINLSNLDTFRCLNTRNLYMCVIEKILDILHKDDDNDLDSDF